MGRILNVNRAGIGALLKSREVQQDLKSRADRIAAAAGDGFEAHVEVGPARARASVVTVTAKAMRAEARNHALTRALDAGRRT